MAVARIHEDAAMRDRAPVFIDRAAAGKHLAHMMARYRRSGALVAAIPAGGVPVAAEMARQLELELEVLPVSKIVLPWNSESGFGAVAFDGSVWVNETAVSRFGLSKEDVKRSTAEARSKVERRLERLCGDGALPEIAGRTVLIVDDGVAAGSTMRAAIAACRRFGAGTLAVVVPTAHAGSLDALADAADEIWCANVRGGFSFAVADAYDHWYDVDDEELGALLERPAP